MEHPGRPVEEYPQRIVSAWNGVDLQSQPESGSPVLATLPYGTEVHLLKQSGQKGGIEGIEGFWSLVHSNEASGWVLDAFLGNRAGIPEGDRAPKKLAAPPVIPLFDDEERLQKSYLTISIDSDITTSSSKERKVIGHLKKNPGENQFHIETLNRICGSGRGDTYPFYEKNGMRFFLEYSWCQVDPGDMINTVCVDCDLELYECRIDKKNIYDASSGSGLFRDEISCERIGKTFCKENCTEKESH